jgi:hypothetical protein
LSEAYPVGWCGNAGCPDWVHAIEDWSEMLDWCADTFGYDVLVKRVSLGRPWLNFVFRSPADEVLFVLLWRQ